MFAFIIYFSYIIFFFIFVTKKIIHWNEKYGVFIFQYFLFLMDKVYPFQIKIPSGIICIYMEISWNLPNLGTFNFDYDQIMFPKNKIKIIIYKNNNINMKHLFIDLYIYTLSFIWSDWW